MTATQRDVRAYGGLPASQPRYVPDRAWRLLCEHVQDGKSLADIASTEGFTPSRARTIVAETWLNITFHQRHDGGTP